jgi:membrane-bound lytic murein transglycosylase B
MTAMTTPRFGRVQRASALLPLALLSAAWTASLAGVGATSAASADEKPSQTLPDGTNVPSEAIQAAASVSTPGTVAPGIGNARRAVSTASTSGIPSAALAAYQRAETVINAADKTCKLPWQLVAAIGRVESDHGRTNGNSLDSNGVARPGIYGLPLNGKHHTSRILDTDAGQYDADAKFDRAVGPMQFIPSTWSVVGVDADGDAQRNPQDIDDAALATAVYLCSGNDDLSTSKGQHDAVFRYNHSASYVSLVLSIMRAYMSGDFTSVPNGTTSAGYFVPAAPAHNPTVRHHQGHPNATGGNGGGTTPPSTSTSNNPPTTTPTQTPSAPTGGGGGGGTPNLPAPSVPPLPTPTTPPADEVLTQQAAELQCLADGLLKGTPAFDKCVAALTG